ncbi:flagellar motor protein MotB [Uliginosibacterium sp. H3]|uniref:Flagellar motor protein MotB n=1 Tax=Uliginosibacterium silvisoli TaxID=3114758 RepID=A0ABU6K7I0_9RHOO|nr:flagellar motor protein MotB [Uliginosibacterium sp. H3]
MADNNQQPIVVKRIKKGGGGAHGGAWKIAYADFVTAMMAFFLLMWLLGSTTKGDLKGIADYFQNPLRLSLNGGPGTGASASPLEGGGSDLTKTIGDSARSDFKQKRVMSKIIVTPPEQTQNTKFAVDKGKNFDVPDAIPDSKKMEVERVERSRLQELKERIEAIIEASPDLRQFKNQLLLDMTPDGLRVQIVDEQNRPMFDTSSAELKPYTRVILRALGQELNRFGSRLSISGHTDAAQYAGSAAGFSNWELSANRANAARRELIVGGLDKERIIRVLGQASILPLDRSDPFSAANRRISIVVLNHRAEEDIMNEGVRENSAGMAPPSEPLPSGPRTIPQVGGLPPRGSAPSGPPQR